MLETLAPDRVVNQAHLTTIQNILTRYYIFEALTAAEQAKLIKSIKINRYLHNQVIYQQYQQCQDIMLILEGRLKFCWSSFDGKHMTNSFIPTGNLINIIPIMTQSPLYHDYISNGTSIIASIPADIFLSILDNNSKLAVNILKLVCFRYQFLLSDMYHSVTSSLKLRLSREIIFLAKHHGSILSNRIKINIKISQNSFAELLNTSRQKINKEFKSLISDGIIVLEKGYLYVLNLTALHAILGQDPYSKKVL